MVRLYDTTLRDGAQSEDVSFSLEDKIRIAYMLDDLGFHYIEGGYPGSNPKDAGFFEALRLKPLRRARLAAFGMTRRAGIAAEKDENLRALLAAETPVITIVGKSWDFQVTEALRISLDENLELIADSIRYLDSRVDEVVYDAEHFFDGFKRNADYAMKSLRAAVDGGARVLALCDTNGGTMYWEIAAAVEAVRAAFPKVEIGIHCHNDGDMAVANSLAAVRAGATHVQGTVNGLGERCGNANLLSIAADLALKMEEPVLSAPELRQLTNVSRLVYELANIQPSKRQAYVGQSAFAHKGGMHVSAIQRATLTYEHIEPETVGNSRRVLVSDLAGRANVLFKAREFGIDLESQDGHAAAVLEKLKELESRGYRFEGADGSFELLMKRTLGLHKTFFKLVGFRVIDEKRAGDTASLSEASVQIEVDGRVAHTVALGDGPVNALDQALRKALITFYPELESVKLLDYKVRVVSSNQGTDAVVRVLLESGDGEDKWGTVGVSENIIEASWQALVDSFDYRLYKSEQRGER
jgi:2-isopropylmalate synthase